MKTINLITKDGRDGVQEMCNFQLGANHGSISGRY